MNENTLVDSFFFHFNLLFSHFFLSYLHFCLLSHLEIIRCIIKSLILNFNARIWPRKAIYWSPKWIEHLARIYTQITMFHVNLTPPPNPKNIPTLKPDLTGLCGN